MCMKVALGTPDFLPVLYNNGYGLTDQISQVVILR